MEYPLTVKAGLNDDDAASPLRPAVTIINNDVTKLIKRCIFNTPLDMSDSCDLLIADFSDLLKNKSNGFRESSIFALHGCKNRNEVLTAGLNIHTGPVSVIY